MTCLTCCKWHRTIRNHQTTRIGSNMMEQNAQRPGFRWCKRGHWPANICSFGWRTLFRLLPAPSRSFAVSKELWFVFMHSHTISDQKVDMYWVCMHIYMYMELFGIIWNDKECSRSVPLYRESYVLYTVYAVLWYDMIIWYYMIWYGMILLHWRIYMIWYDMIWYDDNIIPSLLASLLAPCGLPLQPKALSSIGICFRITCHGRRW